MKKRVIGFDHGNRRIGTATGNFQTGTTQALETLQCNNGQPDWEKILQLVATWRADRLVVGLPLLPDGSPGDSCRYARLFADELATRTGLPVALVDERFSSVEADHLLTQGAAPGRSRRRQREKMRDSVAAELIVRTYLSENPEP
mgnify:CR=1 FL=1